MTVNERLLCDDERKREEQCESCESLYNLALVQLVARVKLEPQLVKLQPHIKSSSNFTSGNATVAGIPSKKQAQPLQVAHVGQSRTLCPSYLLHNIRPATRRWPLTSSAGLVECLRNVMLCACCEDDDRSVVTHLPPSCILIFSPKCAEVDLLIRDTGDCDILPLSTWCALCFARSLLSRVRLSGIQNAV